MPYAFECTEKGRQLLLFDSEIVIHGSDFTKEKELGKIAVY